MEWGAGHVTQLQVLHVSIVVVAVRYACASACPLHPTHSTRHSLSLQGNADGSAYMLTLLVELALPR